MRTPPPRVTIVLPTYNGSRYLSEAVESCRVQTFTDWELVVVDDCSTDGTPQLIERLAAKEPRIRSFRNAVNSKLPATLNRGFGEAKGTYLTWMSDDNVWRPNAIETMAGFLDANAEADVVYSAFTWIDPDGKPLSKAVPHQPQVLVNYNCVGLSFLYRRRVLEVVGDYSTDHFLAEDYDYWLRAFARCTMRPIDADLLLVRRHEGSLTERFPQRVLEETCRVVERNLPELRQHRPEVALRAQLVLARRYLDLGASSRARGLFFSALRRHPLRTWSQVEGPRLPTASFFGSWVAGRLTAAREALRREPRKGATA